GRGERGGWSWAWAGGRGEGGVGWVAMTAAQLGAKRLHRRVAMAADKMVVDHADRLHKGIDDGRPAKFEAALRQFLGHCARHRGFGRHLPSTAKMIDLRPTLDEVP